MLIAIHQSNFCPWMPFFEKMYRSDLFILLNNCQFEKNGYQNRCKVWDKWWTNPVMNGKEPIISKLYTDKNRVVNVNYYWIFAIAKTLSIDTEKIKFDFPTEKKGTERIIEICKYYHADKYLTNPEAVNKYLDEKMMKKEGIDIVPFKSKHNRHVFEMFAEYGIEKTRQMMRCKV